MVLRPKAGWPWGAVKELVDVPKHPIWVHFSLFMNVVVRFVTKVWLKNLQIFPAHTAPEARRPWNY